MTTIENQAQILHNKYSGSRDSDKEDFKTELNEYIDDFDLSILSAKQAIESKLIKEENLSHLLPQKEDKDVLLTEIESGDTWINIVVHVKELWDTTHENIAYAGTVEDQSGIKKFIAWDQALDEITTNKNTNILQEGKTYYFKDIITKEFNEKIELKICKETSIFEIDTNIDITYEQIHGEIVKADDITYHSIRCPNENCRQKITPKNSNTETSDSIICDQHGEIHTVSIEDIDITLPITVTNEQKQKTLTLTTKHILDILEITPSDINNLKQIDLSTIKTDNLEDHITTKLDTAATTTTEELIGTSTSATIDNRFGNMPTVVALNEKENEQTDINDLLVETRSLESAFAKL